MLRANCIRPDFTITFICTMVGSSFARTVVVHLSQLITPVENR